MIRRSGGPIVQRPLFWPPLKGEDAAVVRLLRSGEGHTWSADHVRKYPLQLGRGVYSHVVIHLWFRPGAPRMRDGGDGPNQRGQGHLQCYHTTGGGLQAGLVGRGDRGAKQDGDSRGESWQGCWPCASPGWLRPWVVGDNSMGVGQMLPR